jgi:RNA polymerase sigma-70 factor (ECF subfamily)
MPSDTNAQSTLIASGIDTGTAFKQFSKRLIGLARTHLHGRLKDKVDPEDVVQSAYKSLLVRYGDETLAAQGWEELWGLLTLITIRKCADRARYYQAECRELRRELSAPSKSDSNPDWHLAGREPTPDEAAILGETVAELFQQLNGDERNIVELSLQGYSTQEISEQTGRAERSVRRLREQVRKRLEQQQAEERPGFPS